jgi:hypothetical protein
MERKYDDSKYDDGKLYMMKVNMDNLFIFLFLAGCLLKILYTYV